MAKEKESGGHGGAQVPSSNVKLEGDIITASTQFGDKNFEQGYPESPGSLHMKNLAGGKGKGGK